MRCVLTSQPEHFLITMPSLRAALAASALAVAAAGNMTLATYFVDWAQYRAPPYTFTATNLAPIVPALQEIVISFVYFCPPPGTSPMPYWALPPYGSCTDETAYTLMSVDPKDESFLATIEGFKAQNPALKVLSECAPGTRNSYFPAHASATWHWQCRSAAGTFLARISRQWPRARRRAPRLSRRWRPGCRRTVLTVLRSTVRHGGLRGVGCPPCVNPPCPCPGEYPCSAPRTNPVEISCSEFHDVADAGGNCPADTNNSIALIQELRAGLPAGSIIAIDSQAAKVPSDEEGVKYMWPYVDYFHLMTYDYSGAPAKGGGGGGPRLPPASLPPPAHAPLPCAVPDIVDAGGMAPNAPLFNPSAPTLQMSMN